MKNKNNSIKCHIYIDIGLLIESYTTFDEGAIYRCFALHGISYRIKIQRNNEPIKSPISIYIYIYDT